MKKRYFIFALMIMCLTACGKDKNEEADIIEEAVESDNKASNETVSENTVEEPEENADWKRAYVDVVKMWNLNHKSDDSVGYELAYIDDDNIPELILFCDDEAWYALDMYTCIDKKAVHMQIDRGYVGSDYLSPGCQGKGEAYLEKEGIYLQSSGIMGSVSTTGYRMQGDKFYEIFNYFYANASWDESEENPYSYHLEYTDKGGKEIIIDQKITAKEKYYGVEAVPEAKDLEREFDISFDSKKELGSEPMSYTEIMDYLGFPIEADENESAYAKLYLNEIDSLYSSGKANRFALIYVDEDEIPELIAVNSEGSINGDDSVFLYTMYDDAIFLLKSGLVGMFRCFLEYSEKNNLIYSGGGDVSLSQSIEKIVHGKTQELLSAEWSNEYDEATESSIENHSINSKEVSAEDYYKELYGYLNVPYMRIDYDGLHAITYKYNNSYIDETETDIKPYLTYDAIKVDLGNMLENASEDKDAETDYHKTYEKLLKNFMRGGDKYILGDAPEGVVYYPDSGMKFGFKDVNGDGIDEMFISEYDLNYMMILSDDWNTANTGKYFCRYDEENRILVEYCDVDLDSYTYYKLENNELVEVMYVGAKYIDDNFNYSYFIIYPDGREEEINYEQMESMCPPELKIEYHDLTEEGVAKYFKNL